MSRPATRLANSDTITGLLTLGLGLGVLALIPAEVSRDGFARMGDVRSPAFFPILAGGAMTLLSILLLARGALRTVPPVTVDRLPRILAVTLSLCGATILIFWLGYVATSALLIAALSWAFGNRRHWTILAMAVLVPIGIHLLFEGVLNVLLPEGPF